MLQFGKDNSVRMSFDTREHRRGSSPPYQKRGIRDGDRVRHASQFSRAILSDPFAEPTKPAGDAPIRDDQAVDESRWQNEGGIGKEAASWRPVPHLTKFKR
jgi:hypothetical protein